MELKQALHKKVRSHRRTASQNLDDLCFKSQSRKQDFAPKSAFGNNQSSSKPKLSHQRNYSTSYLLNPDHQVVKLLKVTNESKQTKQTIVDCIDPIHSSNTKQDNDSLIQKRKDPYFLRDRFIDEPGMLDFTNFTNNSQKGFYSNLNSERSKRIMRKNLFVRQKIQNPSINQYNQFQNFLKLRKTKVMNSNMFSMQERQYKRETNNKL